MASQLDVYRDWLGVPDSDRPLNYYQVLRLKKFEDDAAKIRSNYRKLNAHVRKYAAGDYAKESQDLLNELAKAMLCLTDRRRKEEYDASLGREKTTAGRRYSFEQLLVGRRVITAEQLTKAKNYANAVGLELRDAVLQQKLAPPDSVMQVYAESLGLPYIDLSDVGVDLELVPKVPAQIARQHSCAPVMVDDGILLMASPNPLHPEVEDELRLRAGYPVRTVICTVAGMNEVINEHYPRSVAAAELAAANPAASKKSAAVAAVADEDDEQPARVSRGDGDKQTQQLVGVVAYLITAVIVYGLLVYGVGVRSAITPIYAAVFVGAAVGGIAYLVAKNMRL